MVYIDDSIMQKGRESSAGSKILENFIAPFDATVLSRLAAFPGGGETERVKLAEFGLSDPGELSGAPLLCNDVFGHARVRAAKQGLCFIRPTYGTVSRFGLIPVASSMDQIGIVSKDPEAGFSLLEKIAGFDENDGAMFPEKNYSYSALPDKIKWAHDASFTEKYSHVYDQVLRILAYAEMSNNTSRYDGIKFGYRASGFRNLEELYTKTRTQGFGGEAKLAAVMGCVALSKDYYEAYYDKAMRVRRLIKESFDFKNYDVISAPAESPLAVLAGLPSLTLPHGGKGIQLIAGVKKESALLRAWEVMAK